MPDQSALPTGPAVQLLGTTDRLAAERLETINRQRDGMFRLRQWGMGLSRQLAETQAVLENRIGVLRQYTLQLARYESTEIEQQRRIRELEASDERNTRRVEELEASCASLENERTRWRLWAQDLEAQREELERERSSSHSWARDLETQLEKMQTERTGWRSWAQDLEGQLARLARHPWVRVGRRLRVIPK